MNGCRRSFVARGILLTLALVATQHLFFRSDRVMKGGGGGTNDVKRSHTTNNNKNRHQVNIKAADVSHKLDEAFFPGVSKDTEQMQQAEREYKEMYGGNHTITLNDLADLSFDESIGAASDETWDEAAAARQPIMDLLRAAGLQVDLDVLRRLPRWSEVTDLYGSEPVIYGTETCEPFRNKIPASERFVGVAGQMNTGTNALGKYLLHNVKIAENEISNGILWTVPWYKHGWASLKQRYDYRPPENHTKVFAVVIIKDPLFWMKSMCESPYTLQWNVSSNHCPTLVDAATNSSVPVKIRWSKGYIRSWPSLAHLWSMWYREYYESSMPRIIIRYEDLLFHTEKVIDSIRDCVGASWKNDTFQWQAAPAKTHPYFARFKAPSSLVSAVIKYGSAKGREGTMNRDDQMYARMFIDKTMVDKFHYQDF